MTSKARWLRERMSIDPDAPVQAGERSPRSRVIDSAPRQKHAAEHDDDRADASSPHASPTDDETNAPRPPGSEPDDSGSGAAATSDTSADASPDTASGATAEPTTTPDPSRPRSTSRRPSGRRSGRDRVEWETAIDDPAISVDGNGYRSFYVSDQVFARFRAAIYWTARRPDVDDVPDNMSVGIQDYMDSIASDLERRFNGKGVFPPTPDQVRAHRKRQNRA